MRDPRPQPNDALLRIRHVAVVCNLCVPCAESLGFCVRLSARMKALGSSLLLTALIAGCASPQSKSVAEGECEVHHVAMRKQECDIAYGMPALPIAYFDARQHLFPHAGPIFGGCIVSNTSPKTLVVYRCQKCEAAESNWRPPSPSFKERSFPQRVF